MLFWLDARTNRQYAVGEGFRQEGDRAARGQGGQGQGDP